MRRDMWDNWIWVVGLVWLVAAVSFTAAVFQKPAESPYQKAERECAEACGDRGGKVWMPWERAVQCICGADRGACYPVPVGSALETP